MLGVSLMLEVFKYRCFYTHCTFFLFLFFGLFVFLGPHLQHMEVPRLGVESELQPPAYTKAQQLQIQAASVTYTTAHSNSGSLPHWASQGWICILVDTS